VAAIVAVEATFPHYHHHHYYYYYYYYSATLLVVLLGVRGEKADRGERREVTDLLRAGEVRLSERGGDLQGGRRKGGRREGGRGDEWW